ncbi:hypothetical protein ACJX0J_007287, partial [Zea mays]
FWRPVHVMSWPSEERLSLWKSCDSKHLPLHWLFLGLLNIRLSQHRGSDIDPRKRVLVLNGNLIKGVYSPRTFESFITQSHTLRDRLVKIVTDYQTETSLRNGGNDILK